MTAGDNRDNRDLGDKIVRAAWVLGLSLVASAVLLGVGAIITVRATAERGALAVETAARDITKTVERAFGEPLRLEANLATPAPVTIQGPGLEGAIPINTDVFTDNQDGKRGKG